ncbi:MAG: amidohydrolase family protein [Bacteroidia bacterium]|nr:amidohydrolase family protein [Bacteroidia bacterium]
MRYYHTPTLFDGLGNVAFDMYIGVNNEGIITSLCSTTPVATNAITYLKGAIMPAMVNAHCHLELSYLQGKISKHNGINDFITELENLKTNHTKTIQHHAQIAQKTMCNNGIIAVGDISNTDATFAIKEQQQLYYHTFVELYGFSPSRAKTAYTLGLDLFNQLPKGKASLTPHAPYSVSKQLLQLINAHCKLNNAPLTIHTQESKAENEFFEFATGKTFNRIHNFGIDLTAHMATHQSAMQYIAPQLPATLRTQYVHNTFTTAHDVALAQTLNPNTYWCLCPNTNIYIENSLPNIPMLLHHNALITLGTDSLASNDQLCIVAEMKTLQRYYPQLTTALLVQWATHNGAKFLGIDMSHGNIAIGRKAQLVELQNFNHETQCLVEATPRVI